MYHKLINEGVLNQRIVGLAGTSKSTIIPYELLKTKKIGRIFMAVPCRSGVFNLLSQTQTSDFDSIKTENLLAGSSFGRRNSQIVPELNFEKIRRSELLFLTHGSLGYYLGLMNSSLEFFNEIGMVGGMAGGGKFAIIVDDVERKSFSRDNILRVLKNLLEREELARKHLHVVLITSINYIENKELELIESYFRNSDVFNFRSYKFDKPESHDCPEIYDMTKNCEYFKHLRDKGIIEARIFDEFMKKAVGIVEDIIIDRNPFSEREREELDHMEEISILIFLPGSSSCIGLENSLNNSIRLNESGAIRNCNIKLFVGVITNSKDFGELFDGSKGRRKNNHYVSESYQTVNIIISTSILESTIKIRNLVGIIDFGLRKKKLHNSHQELEEFRTCFITEEFSRKRMHRSTLQGKIVKVFQFYSNDVLESFEFPEIYSMDLQYILLRHGPSAIREFIHNEEITNQEIQKAINILQFNNFLLSKSGRLDLSEYGELFIKLNFQNIRQFDILKNSILLGYSREGIVLSILLSIRSVFKPSFQRINELYHLLNVFSIDEIQRFGFFFESDLITNLFIIKKFLQFDYLSAENSNRRNHILLNLGRNKLYECLNLKFDGRKIDVLKKGYCRISRILLRFGICSEYELYSFSNFHEDDSRIFKYLKDLNSIITISLWNNSCIVMTSKQEDFPNDEEYASVKISLKTPKRLNHSELISIRRRQQTNEQRNRLDPRNYICAEEIREFMESNIGFIKEFSVAKGNNQNKNDETKYRRLFFDEKYFDEEEMFVTFENKNNMCNEYNINRNLNIINISSRLNVKNNLKFRSKKINPVECSTGSFNIEIMSLFSNTSQIQFRSNDSVVSTSFNKEYERQERRYLSNNLNINPMNQYSSYCYGSGTEYDTHDKTIVCNVTKNSPGIGILKNLIISSSSISICELGNEYENKKYISFCNYHATVLFELNEISCSEFHNLQEILELRSMMKTIPDIKSTGEKETRKLVLKRRDLLDTINNNNINEIISENEVSEKTRILEVEFNDTSNHNKSNYYNYRKIVENILSFLQLECSWSWIIYDSIEEEIFRELYRIQFLSEKSELETEEENFQKVYFFSEQIESISVSKIEQFFESLCGEIKNIEKVKKDVIWIIFKFEKANKLCHYFFDNMNLVTFENKNLEMKIQTTSNSRRMNNSDDSEEEEEFGEKEDEEDERIPVFSDHSKILKKIHERETVSKEYTFLSPHSEKLEDLKKSIESICGIGCLKLIGFFDQQNSIRDDRVRVNKGYLEFKIGSDAKLFYEEFTNGKNRLTRFKQFNVFQAKHKSKMANIDRVRVIEYYPEYDINKQQQHPVDSVSSFNFVKKSKKSVSQEKNSLIISKSYLKIIILKILKNYVDLKRFKESNVYQFLGRLGESENIHLEFLPPPHRSQNTENEENLKNKNFRMVHGESNLKYFNRDVCSGSLIFKKYMNLFNSPFSKVKYNEDGNSFSLQENNVIIFPIMNRYVLVDIGLKKKQKLESKISERFELSTVSLTSRRRHEKDSNLVKFYKNEGFVEIQEQLEKRIIGEYFVGEKFEICEIYGRKILLFEITSKNSGSDLVETHFSSIFLSSKYVEQKILKNWTSGLNRSSELNNFSEKMFDFCRNEK